jgi:hypothetical protein
MAEMSEDELMALLSSEKAEAIATMDASEISSEREDAMDYYLGDMTKDLPSVEGQSKAVSTDVADTVLGMMPFLMDIFCSSEDVVRFNPVGPDDEKAAEQESDYVNHVFMNQNPGFVVLYEFIFDALLQKLGAVKVWWEEHDEEEKETYLGLSEDQFAQVAMDVLQSDGQLEIIEHDVEQKPDPMSGQPLAVHNVKLLRTKNYAQAKVLACAPEEVGWGRDTRTMRECNYFFHSPPNQTEASLIAQGYDEEQIKSLPTHTFGTNSEELARNTVGEDDFAGGTANRATRSIQVTEHYVRMDYKGEGKPCLYKVTTAGEKNQVLKKDGKPDVEEVDVIPFAVQSPIIQPHRLCGRSLADLVMDIQRINTSLLRGVLDNSYMVANPRHEVAESGANANTLDDLLTVRRNGIVRVKTPGTVQPLATQSIVGELLPVMTYMDQIREMRSGVTRTGQGVDANALQNQSATAVAHVFTMAQAKMKLIARIFAETGVRDMFWLLHATVRKHGQKAETVRLRNQWQTVDPRNWVARNDMTVDVGLGSGGKAEQFAQTMALANFQKELVLGGKSNIVDDAKLYNTAAKLAKIMGHKSPDPFFNDPTATKPDGTPKYPAPQPQPPEAVQVAQIKAQTDQQTMQVQSQLDAQADQRKAQIETVQMQADIAAQDKKTQAEMIQSEREYQLKEKLAILEFNLERELKLAEEARKEREHQQAMQMQAEQHRQSLEAGVFKVAQGQQAHEQKMEAAETAAKKPKGGK